MTDGAVPVKDSTALEGSLEDLRLIYGLDTDRKWATSVQLFWDQQNPGQVLLVFRETLKARPTDGDEEGPEQEVLGKNVASLIMPIKVARQLGKILTDSLKKSDDASEA